MRPPGLARGCPIYEFDGSVEVRPVFQREGMSGRRGDEAALASCSATRPGGWSPR